MGREGKRNSFVNRRQGKLVHNRFLATYKKTNVWKIYTQLTKRPHEKKKR